MAVALETVGEVGRVWQTEPPQRSVGWNSSSRERHWKGRIVVQQEVGTHSFQGCRGPYTTGCLGLPAWESFFSYAYSLFTLISPSMSEMIGCLIIHPGNVFFKLEKNPES